MKFLYGFVTALIVLAVLGAAVLASGSYNVAAISSSGELEKKMAGFAIDRSVAARAPTTVNPLKPSPDLLRGGLDHYREMCVTCHGAPGVDPSEIGAGLNPPAPDLSLKRIQARSDGQLFWIVQNGIRMTGMPACGPTHDEKEIWKIVAFVRHLPALTPEEQKMLAAGEGEHGAPHGSERGGEHESH